MKKLIVLSFVTFFSIPAFGQVVPDGVTTPVTPVTPTDSGVTQQTVKERVIFLLSGYEFFPERKDLDAVGTPEEITSVLREIVVDETARPSHRVRAVDALGHYDDAATATFLKNQMAAAVSVKGKKARVLKAIRHHAFTAFGRANRETSVDHVAPFLSDSNLQIRLTAISTLGKFGGLVGKEKLRLAKRLERDHVVRSAFRKYVPD